MVEIKFEKEKNRSVAISDGNVIGECDFIITDENIKIRDGILSDVAPTLLDLMGVEIPEDMKETEYKIK